MWEVFTPSLTQTTFDAYAWWHENIVEKEEITNDGLNPSINKSINLNPFPHKTNLQQTLIKNIC